MHSLQVAGGNRFNAVAFCAVKLQSAANRFSESFSLTTFASSESLPHFISESHPNSLKIAFSHQLASSESLPQNLETVKLLLAPIFSNLELEMKRRERKDHKWLMRERSWSIN
ncbi:hypothetical protein QL285_060969 [Trifolium repens]|nr:hypothetical protein QL285_060969 [Trifolium repens]